MPSFVNHLFNIRSREWPRVVWLFIMAFIAVTGISWGRLTVQPLFWHVVGVDNLGYSFVIEGILAIGLVAAYTAFADRLSNDRLMVGIVLLSATAVFVGWALLNSGQEIVGAFWLYPLITVIPNLFNLHWWTYVTGYYDARAAKRVVPVVASNARLAGAFAGFSVGWLTGQFGSVTGIILLWGITMIIVGGLVWLAPFVLREPRQTAVAGSSAAASTDTFRDSVREGFQYVTGSPYLRWLAWATLLVTLLLTLFKYQSSFIIDAAFAGGSTFTRSYDSASAFLGQLEAVTNILMLPVQLFLLSRLIGKIGLNKTNMVYPSGMAGVGVSLLIFTLLSFSPGLILMGSLAYLMTNVFNTTLRNPVNNLLFNAVPFRIRGRARAFVNGMLVPVAAIVGGLLLLLPFVTAVIWVVPLLLAVVGLIYLAVSVRVSRQYTNALVSMLEQEDYSFLLAQEAADLTIADPAALKQLQDQLQRSESDEFTLFLVTLISNAGGHEVVPVLAEVARSGNTHVRSATLDILAATDVRSPAVPELFAEFLQDEDATVRRSALAGLERVVGRSDNHYLTVATPMLEDADIEVKTQALPALLRFGDGVQREQALQVVRNLLASEVNGERASALHALGKTDDVGYIGDISAKLADESDRVRLEAALVIEALSGRRLNRAHVEQIESTMGPLLADPVERVRQASLVTLAQVGNHNSYAKLVETLKDPSPQIQITAVAVLSNLGKKIIPMVHPQLDSHNPQVRKMAAVILGRVNKREYGPLVTAQIQANLLQMAENVGYVEALAAINSYPSIKILQNVFREENDRLADEIFFLLTAVKDADSLAVIREYLVNEDERISANALEALESLTSPQTAELIAVMLSPDASPAAIVRLTQEAWDLQFPATAEAMEKLATDLAVDPWPRSIAIYAIGEIGRAMMTPQIQPVEPPPTAEPPEPPPEKRHRRRSQAELLDALIDDNEEESAAAPEGEALTDRRQERRRRSLQAATLLDELARETGDEPEPEATAQEIETIYYPPPAIAKKFTLTRLLAWLHAANMAPEAEVRTAVKQASDRLAGKEAAVPQKEDGMLSTIERIIFLKEVLFFREMTVDQLKVLATVCEETFYNEDEFIYKENDPGGVLYVVVRGRVGIERESRRGVVARLATIEAYSYFGEMNLFDDSPRTNTAVALQDTLTLNLQREPLIALARQYPDLSLELINVLSQRLRETTDQVARLSKSHSRSLHKVFDQLE